MEHPLLVKSESYATRLGYPHDSVVYLKDKCYFDEAFQKQPGYKPHWFMMSHGHPSVANVIMCAADDGTPLWKTKDMVLCNDELRYDYGDVPKEWNGDCCH
eukprot:SAG11_NODE_7991_length_1072_cov_1.635149_1_plen_101_part_00